MRGIIIFLLIAAVARADLYMWTDDKGVTHFGSSPPKGGLEKKGMRTIKTKNALPAAAPSPDADAQSVPGAISPAPISKPRVELYATSWCKFCQKARDYLNARGVAYQEHDIEADRQALARYKGYGGGGVPLTLIDGAIVRGFNAEEFDRLLKQP